MIAQAELNRNPTRAQSVVAMFEAMVARAATRTATKQKRDGKWVDTSWGEMGRRARAISDGLASLGVVKGDRVAIIGETTTEWILADLGVMGAAATCVPIYQSNKAHEVQYILENSGAKFIFCDGEAQVAKIREHKDRLPALEGVIRFTGSAGSSARSPTWRRRGPPGAAPTRARTRRAWRRSASAIRPASSTPRAPPETRRASSSPTVTGCTRRRRWRASSSSCRTTSSSASSPWRTPSPR
jgi:long-chain acyl-CoA synthetase